MSKTKPIIGALEYCNLPSLNIEGLTVRVDTGAATSSLHVDDIEEFEKNGEAWVRFTMHPDIHDVSKVVRKEAQIITQKKVKSSTATLERRYTIETDIVMADMRWPIQITLTDRSSMTYLMLFGRQGMADRFLVDPASEFLLTKN
ncbi:ATP-dependent zinc protease [Alteromonas sediminis]|uniref:ATP-dependent zinc protease n=1 Tax=Alteromonas sediminis TaxID=2259342 RepID=A0A3N5Y0W0_9ALTE|nr:ATP-dependent zinc protease [Alteromonas sediminis]RPJ67367.1 ATP-dependent zinc protease [Alteromonas sediminis]